MRRFTLAVALLATTGLSGCGAAASHDGFVLPPVSPVSPQSAAVHQSVPTAAGPVFRWQHFGAAPYAATRAEAMRTRESAFRKLGFPEPVVKLLMAATVQAGQRTRLVNGDRLSAMMSKGGHVDRNVLVDFVKPPASGRMEYAAPAEKWQVEWHGRTYAAVLPDICNNWSAILPTPFVAASGSCPTGWSMRGNAWTMSSLPNELRSEAQGLIEAANSRNSESGTNIPTYRPDDVSRTLGGRLRKEVRTRAPYTGDLQVEYLDLRTHQVVREVGTIHVVNGQGVIHFPDDPRDYIERIVWNDGFVSPTRSGGIHQMLLFPKEWGTYCLMNIHGILPN
jgi:hypothetical protein